MGIHIHFGSNRPPHHHNHHHRTSYRGGSASVSPKTGVLIGLLCFVIGIGLLFFYNHRVNNPKYDDYVSTSGKIYDYSEKYDYDDGYMYSPVIEYIVAGQKYYIDSPTWSSARPLIGKSVKVKYDPNEPKNAIISGSESGNWIMFVAGIVFTGVGALAFGKSLVDLARGSKNEKIEDNKTEIE